MSTIRIFVSYSHDDGRWVQPDSLIPWLAQSLRKEDVVFWYDSELHPGVKFRERIEDEIEKADIAMLLISEGFFSSDFIEEVELPKIKDRADRGELVMIPILVEPCGWEEKDFLRSRIMMPSKLTPLIDYTDNDKGWVNVRAEILNGIRKTIRNLPLPASGGQTNEVLQRASQPEPVPKTAQPAGKSSEPISTDALTLPKPQLSTLQSFTEDLGNGVKLEMVAIPGGTFLMGSPEGQGSDHEHPQHRVTLSPFLIGKYQVTQAQWQAVMDNNPSFFKGDNLPVESVLWNDAVKFCDRLSIKTGKDYRLPTEAEWEYSCRAGTMGKYSFGDKEAFLGQYAWYAVNSGSTTHPVGQRKPNDWGLYDMHGNVWELCQDWFDKDYYKQSPSADPQGHLFGKSSSPWMFRVVRGGAWNNNVNSCRAAFRDVKVPVNSTGGLINSVLGFRVVCEVRTS